MTYFGGTRKDGWSDQVWCGILAGSKVAIFELSTYNFFERFSSGEDNVSLVEHPTVPVVEPSRKDKLVGVWLCLVPLKKTRFQRCRCSSAQRTFLRRVEDRWVFRSVQ